MTFSCVLFSGAEEQNPCGRGVRVIKSHIRVRVLVHRCMMLSFVADKVRRKQRRSCCVMSFHNSNYSGCAIDELSALEEGMPVWVIFSVAVVACRLHGDPLTCELLANQQQLPTLIKIYSHKNMV